jgi:hypothetical protein
VLIERDFLGFQRDSLLWWASRQWKLISSSSAGIHGLRACLGGSMGRCRFFDNYDPALLRRIQRHIHFRLPNVSMRRELFALHLPNPERVEADHAALAGLSKGLSGGDILNVCVNAIYAGSVDSDPERWVVTQAMLEREIGKAKKAKAEHSGEKEGPRRRIGFQPG